MTAQNENNVPIIKRNKPIKDDNSKNKIDV